jgi:hypothetical protein
MKTSKVFIPSSWPHQPCFYTSTPPSNQLKHATHAVFEVEHVGLNRPLSQSTQQLSAFLKNPELQVHGHAELCKSEKAALAGRVASELQLPHSLLRVLVHGLEYWVF